MAYAALLPWLEPSGVDEQLWLLQKLLELDDLQIVFTALVLTDAFIRSERETGAYGPRLRENAGIGNNRFVGDRSWTGARQPFGNLHLVGVMSGAVAEPCTIVEAANIDNERVAFPVAHGIPEICGFHIVGMRSPISRNDADPTKCLVNKDDFVRELNNLERHRHGVNPRDSHQQALPHGIIDILA